MMNKWKIITIVVSLCIVAFFGIKYNGFDPSLISYDYCVASGNRILAWYDEMGGWWSECRTPDEKTFIVDCNKFPSRCG